MSRAGAIAVVDWTLRVLAAALLASMLYTGLHDASQAWDVFYYHLPFAARLGGVVRESEYVFSAANQARFEGFTLFGERVQGALWRLTGRAESTNLVALSSVPIVAWVLRARYRVPWPASVLALFAVPLVHAHATSGYVDLPANAAACVAVLIAIDAWSGPGNLDARALAIALCASAVAANTKSLLHPIVLVALVAIAVRVAAERRGKALGAIALASPVIFATPLANLFTHGNPYYPVRMTLAGHVLPGTEEAYASSPDWLEHAPRFVRFACSVVEVGLRPMTDPRRWTVDQWMPSDSSGPRMGGFFGAYAVALVLLLLWYVVTDRSRETRACAIGFAIVTAIVSCMPQSHELRYYLVWMIALVAIDLRLACRARSIGPRAVAILGALACAVVIVVTRGVYVWPTGSTFRELMAAHVDAHAADSIQDGERVCVHTPRWDILWAAPFHAPKRYVVKSAETVDECAGYRVIE